MKRLEKVGGLELIAQALIGAVVVEQDSQQGLFSLDIGRCVGDFGGVRGRAEVKKRYKGHNVKR